MSLYMEQYHSEGKGCNRRLVTEGRKHARSPLGLSKFRAGLGFEWRESEMTRRCDLRAGTRGRHLTSSLSLSHIVIGGWVPLSGLVFGSCLKVA